MTDRDNEYRTRDEAARDRDDHARARDDLSRNEDAFARRATQSARNVQTWATMVLIVMVAALFYYTYQERQELEAIREQSNSVQMAAEEARDAAQQTEQVLIAVSEGGVADEDVAEALGDLQLLRDIIVEDICDNDDAPSACARVE